MIISHTITFLQLLFTVFTVQLSFCDPFKSGTTNLKEAAMRHVWTVSKQATHTVSEIGLNFQPHVENLVKPRRLRNFHLQGKM